MPHSGFWFLLACVVIAAPIALLFVLVWRKTTSPARRLGLLALASIAFFIYAFFAMFWLPGAIFSWYEAGRWPAKPLGRREYTISAEQGVAIRVRGREIRHAAAIERDWWWDLAYQRASGPEAPIGSAWSRTDSLSLRVVQTDSLLAVIVTDDAIAFLRTAKGYFRSYTFAYPFLNNETHWRNVTWSMALDLGDVARLHRDLDVAEHNANPAAAIERFDLQARQVLVRYRWPSRHRLATFTIDPVDGHLALVDLVRTPAPPD